MGTDRDGQIRKTLRIAEIIPAAVAASLVLPIRRKGRKDPYGYVERTETPVRQPVTQEAGDELIWN